MPWFECAVVFVPPRCVQHHRLAFIRDSDRVWQMWSILEGNSWKCVTSSASNTCCSCSTSSSGWVISSWRQISACICGVGDLWPSQNSATLLTVLLYNAIYLRLLHLQHWFHKLFREHRILIALQLSLQCLCGQYSCSRDSKFYKTLWSECFRDHRLCWWNKDSWSGNAYGNTV